MFFGTEINFLISNKIQYKKINKHNRVQVSLSNPITIVTKKMK